MDGDSYYEVPEAEGLQIAVHLLQRTRTKEVTGLKDVAFVQPQGSSHPTRIHVILYLPLNCSGIIFAPYGRPDEITLSLELAAGQTGLFRFSKA